MIALAELTCRLRVKTIEDNDNHLGQPHEAKFLHLEDCSDIGIEIRTSWANKVIKWFGQAGETPSSIRPWNFIAELDGSVVSLPLPGVEGSLAEGYPIHFQIPSSSLEGLDHEEKVSRAEKFAMASLLYEIMTGRKPLQELPDDELRHRFSNGEFPDDVDTLPNMLFILSGWSAHFSQELTRLVNSPKVTLFQAAKNYARAHPVATTLQVVGTTVSVASCFAVPILGVVGFGAVGPVSSSAAVAWHTSIGVVKAGSLFSWCQSAAMGGSALGAIQVAGMAGAGLAGVGSVPELMELFKLGFRTSRGGPE